MRKHLIPILLCLMALASPAWASNCVPFTYTLTNGQTADANQVMANFNTLLNCANNNLAHNGANSDITSISGLTTPLTVPQGGTGLGTLTSGWLPVGNGTSTPTFFGPTSAAFRSALAGLTLSNDGSLPTTVLDVSAGAAIDSLNTSMITLGAFTKSTAGAWAAGTGANGMGNALTIAVGTWYHVFAIINSGAADVYFDTSVTAANAPNGTTAFRRIGSFKTDGSAHILGFVQDGTFFQWKSPVADFNGNTQGTSAVLYTVSVPPGVNVRWVGNAAVLDSVSSTFSYLSDPATTDVAPTAQSGTAPGSTAINTSTTVDATAFVSGGIRTNTSAQIRARSATGAATTSFRLFTLGWYDSLGKNN